MSDSNSFFIVVVGSVEVHAVLPTRCRKTNNMREFLCKKDQGDMVYMKAVKNLILECNARDLYEREESDHCEHVDHKKNILDIIDTINIVSAVDSTILQMDWNKFEARFNKEGSTIGRSRLNIDMLRAIMETNVADYLMQIPVFKELPNSKLELLTRFCHYSIEKKGSIICKEGDYGDKVFILLSGEVKVHAMASKRMTELVKEGILSPLQKSSSSSSIDKTSDITDTHNCKASVNHNTEYDPKHNLLLKRRQTLALAGHHCRREKVEKLSFPSIDSDGNDTNQIETCAQMNYSLDIPDPNLTVELAHFKAGDYFGEISTFIDLPRAATVTATTNVLMVSISKASFRNFYHSISPHLEKGLEVIVKRQIMQTLLQTKSPFLEVISVEDASSMADLSIIRTAKSGEIIFSEGDDADDFCFIYSGQLSVTKTSMTKDKPRKVSHDGKETARDQIQIGTLYSGDYFGEMALLNNSKRLATIVATSTTVLLSVTRENFYLCFRDKPQLIAEFLVRMKGRQVDMKTILNYDKSKEAFAAYLTSTNCHALSCYVAIVNFEAMMKNNARDDLKLKALSILREYIIEGAPYLVNLDYNTKAFDNFHRGNLEEESNIFKGMKDELMQVLETDLFLQFKESDIFNTLQKNMRTYDDIDVQLLA